MKYWGPIFFVIYILFGLYFVNLSIEFYSLPRILSEFNNWIILVGGVLILIGAINHLRVGRRRKNIFAQ